MRCLVLRPAALHDAHVIDIDARLLQSNETRVWCVVLGVGSLTMLRSRHQDAWLVQASRRLG